VLGFEGGDEEAAHEDGGKPGAGGAGEGPHLDGEEALLGQGEEGLPRVALGDEEARSREGAGAGRDAALAEAAGVGPAQGGHPMGILAEEIEDPSPRLGIGREVEAGREDEADPKPRKREGEEMARAPRGAPLAPGAEAERARQVGTVGRLPGR
jgi:hypothetical protein